MAPYGVGFGAEMNVAKTTKCKESEEWSILTLFLEDQKYFG
jgi:hypothetical protein